MNTGLGKLAVVFRATRPLTNLGKDLEAGPDTMSARAVGTRLATKEKAPPRGALSWLMRVDYGVALLQALTSPDSKPSAKIPVASLQFVGVIT
mgnify:CR=1 FL=1